MKGKIRATAMTRGRKLGAAAPSEPRLRALARASAARSRAKGGAKALDMEVIAAKAAVARATLRRG